MANLDSLLGDSLAGLGLKTAPRQTMDAMRSAGNGRPLGGAVASPGPTMPYSSAFAAPSPGPGLGSVDPFAGFASPLPQAARPAAAAPTPARVVDLFGNLSVAAPVHTPTQPRRAKYFPGQMHCHLCMPARATMPSAP